MLIGFLDDTELNVDPSDPAPDIFVFGGYFIPQSQLHNFQCRIAEVKADHGFLPHSPVKWNLRDDRLRKFYRTDHFLSDWLYDRLLERSDQIRYDLLAILREFDTKILVSGRCDVHWRETTNVEYYSWAFENLLQRVGLMVEGIQTQQFETSSTLLVVDWPQGGINKSLFDIYLGGYLFGTGMTTKQSYLSGPLKKYRFCDSITHSSTYHSGPLQIADLIVGCCRGFLKWAFTGKEIQRIKGFFDLLIDRFYTDPKGHLNDCGFKVAKANNLDIEAKIKDYQMETIEWEEEDEISS